jgi:hypothetical protein
MEARGTGPEKRKTRIRNHPCLANFRIDDRAHPPEVMCRESLREKTVKYPLGQRVCKMELFNLTCESVDREKGDWEQWVLAPIVKRLISAARWPQRVESSVPRTIEYR